MCNEMCNEIDVTFIDLNETYMLAVFNTSKAIDAANIRFPKVLDIIDDKFSFKFSKKSIFPMKLWCNENELTTNL